MSDTPERTTRDVLQQIDRRLRRLEELHVKHDERNDRAHIALDARSDGSGHGLDCALDDLLTGVCAKLA